MHTQESAEEFEREDVWEPPPFTDGRIPHAPLTENATSVIHQIVDTPELPEGAGLRIATNDEGPQELAVSAAASPEAGDEVIEEDGARVFVEPAVAPLLESPVLDAEVDDQGRVKFQLASQRDSS